MKTNYVAVFITAKDENEAKKITDVLIEERLAACVNCIPSLSSTYWWQGKIEKSIESLLIIKTKNEKLDDLISAVKHYHSYSTPEIIALPIIGGNEDYLNWINEEVV